MKAALSFAWRWSLALTLPICCVFGYWAWLVATDYLSFDLRYGMGMPAHPLHERGQRAAERMGRGLGLELFGSGTPSELRQVSLSIPAAELARLNARLPQSGMQYVSATLWTERGGQNVEVRYRGDYPGHWGYAKKSLRIKTRKSELFEGMRRFNLIVPKFPQQVNNHLGYRLAHALGVLAPRSEMVEVFLNGRPAGLHVLVEQPGETSLRHAGLMPGDLYAGDLIAKGAWPGVSNLLFDAPGLWEKQAVNNHWPESREPLEQLIALVNRPASEAVHAALADLLDLEAFGRFAAAEILTQSFHTNPSHNWRLYYDPWRTAFVPMMWDPNAWGGLWLRTPSGELQFSMDMDLTRLHGLLLTNARFLAARQRALAEFLAGGAERAFLAEVEATVLAAERALAADPNHFTRDPERALADMREMPDRLRALFSAVAREHVVQPAVAWSLGDPGRIALQVSGRGVVDRVDVLLDQPPSGPVRAWMHLHSRAAQLPLATSGNELQISVPLPAQLQPIFATGDSTYVVYGRVPRPTRYELELLGMPDGATIVGVRAHGTDGSAVMAERHTSLPFTSWDLVFGALPQGDFEPRTWNRDVRVAGTRKISGDLRVEPGTVVRLEPGASLIVEGRLIAEGTAEQPIRFVPVDASRPWGTVALRGRGCDGSRIRHCVFEHGSGLASDRGMFEYTGMFSVHDVQDVQVTHSAFRHSHVVDDMVHAVYSAIEFRDCEFVDARADAIDLDLSTGVIDNCLFSRAGNDALDLMTSHCAVIGSSFTDCGDKGISVGEDSDVVVVRATFRRCRFGVQVKDASRALVANADFLENGTALDAYNKNWRYNDGGDVRVLKCVFWDNQSLASADGRSSIVLFDSSVYPPAATDPQVTVDATVDEARDRVAGVPDFGSLADEVAAFVESKVPAGWRIDPARRGSGN